MTKENRPIDAPPRLYHGLFRLTAGANGVPAVVPLAPAVENVPCPTTGRPLRVATVDAGAAAICPRCTAHGHGGFVSFVGDFRMAYACPACQELVWLSGL
jgi:hypothetical protein